MCRCGVKCQNKKVTAPKEADVLLRYLLKPWKERFPGSALGPRFTNVPRASLRCLQQIAVLEVFRRCIDRVTICFLVWLIFRFNQFLIVWARWKAAVFLQQLQ
jgi:hypothetical protein